MSLEHELRRQGDGINLLMERSLQFRYYEGAYHDTPTPHSTGFRSMPMAVFTMSRNRRMRGEFNQQSILTQPGEGLFIPAGINHCFTVDKGDVTQSVWFHAKFLIFDTVDLLSLYECPFHFTGSLAQIGGDLCQALVQVSLSSETDPVKLAVTRQQLGLAFLQLVLAHSRAKPHLKMFQEYIDRLEPALRLIQEDQGGVLTLDRLAQSTHLSRSRFHELFTGTIGMTPMAFVQQRRLERAQHLLRGSHHSVHEIAEKVGYGDQFHFSRIFKKNIGLSPMQFRQQHRETIKSGIRL